MGKSDIPEPVAPDPRVRNVSEDVSRDLIQSNIKRRSGRSASFLTKGLRTVSKQSFLTPSDVKKTNILG